MVPVPFRFESRFGYEFSGFSHGRPHVTLCPVVSWYDGTDGFCLLLVASRETTLSRVVIRKGFRKPQVIGSIPIAGSSITIGCSAVALEAPPLLPFCYHFPSHRADQRPPYCPSTTTYRTCPRWVEYWRGRADVARR